MRGSVKVYDENMNLLAFIQNAYNIGYDLVLNELYRATFSVPAEDPKNKFCQPFNYVEIFDGDERIELFRIMPSKLIRNNRGDIIYRCEHVLATLLDDVLFQYHQIGNIGVFTPQVIRYVLDKQLTKRWVLGTCDFNRQFEYKWENENLLAALFSIAQPFTEQYKWDFDTTGYPWVLHIKKLNGRATSDIIYKKNMTHIEREVDPTSVVTRLYCLGYGEGDNQLNIKSVNNGLPYLEANTGVYGIKASILVDRRFENPDTLKAYGQRILDGLKEPYRNYRIGAVDLYRLNPAKYGKFEVGENVRVIDEEDGINEVFPIVKVEKKDVSGRPGDITIDIANKPRDIAGSISDLADRARINEVYAQGATNQMMIPFYDNADPTNPAIIRIYIPSEMVKVNKCLLNFQLEPFRSYSKAVGGGGGITESTSAGGGSEETSYSGGGGSVTSSDGGGGVATSSDGGGGIATSSSGGGAYATSNEDTTSNIWRISGSYSIPEVMQFVDGHAHGLVPHYHPHDHSFRLPSHDHDIRLPYHDHIVRIPYHSHSVSVPSHSHRFRIPSHSHSISLPNHTHALEFGIFQGTTANSVTIKVDGKNVGTFAARNDIDIIPYLSTDGAGRIKRNTWHTIEIVPNRMTRITANVFLQTFNNSRGGGDY